MVKRLLLVLMFVSCVVLLASPMAIAAPFGISMFSVNAENQNGAADLQAGSHPYALTTSFTLNENPLPEALESSPKDIQVELPTGFFGDPNATPRCEYVSFVNRACPPDSQVGVETTYIVNRGAGEPYPWNNNVYNIEPSPGVAAEFGYYVLGDVAPIVLDVSVRTGGDYGLTVTVPDITEADALAGSTVTLWGVPCAVNGTGCLPQLPLLTNPTSCGVPRTATIRSDSWEDPGKYV